MASDKQHNRLITITKIVRIQGRRLTSVSASALKCLDKGLLTPYILMIALSTHAIFEGLAVGVMEEPSQVANLVVAITLHKGAEAMALVGLN